MKKLLAILLCLVMVLGMVACGGSKNEPAPANDEPEQEALTWRFAHVVAEDTGLHIKMTEAAQKISEATDGLWTIEIYPNSQLGNNNDIAEALVLGTIDMMTNNYANLAGYSKKLEVLQLPYLIQDTSNHDDAWTVFVESGAVQPVWDELLDAGMVELTPWSQGYRILTTAKTPVHSPADMKGLKIRTMESEWHMAHFNALGSNAVPLAYSEVFTALQQGAIDGQENPYTNIVTMGFNEVQKYIIELNHIYDVCPMIASKISYEKLSPEWQQLLAQTIQDLAMEDWLLIDELDAKNAEICAKTSEIIKLTVEERNKFIEAAAPVYEAFKEKHATDGIAELYDNLIAVQATN